MIDEAVRDGRPLLLSELGIAMGSDATKLKLLTKKRLVDFIHDRLSDRYAIVRSGRHTNVYAIVPIGHQSVSVRDQTNSDVVQMIAVDGLNKSHFPRNDFRFWCAFAVPPDEGTKRYLNLVDHTFRNVKDNEPAPMNAVEVPYELTAPADLVSQPERNELIHANIAKWIEANGLLKDQFFPKPKLPKVHVPRTGVSVLQLLIEALDRRQLQSTNLSLDVVAALLDKRA